MTRQALAYGARPISSLMHLSWLQVAMLLLLLALALRAPSFGATGLDWDESLYVVMAQRWLEGGLPYVAVWDQHPVGLPALLAASTWLIGDGLLAARIASLLAVAGTAALLYGVLARRANAPLAGAFGRIVLPVLYESTGRSPGQHRGVQQPGHNRRESAFAGSVYGRTWQRARWCDVRQWSAAGNWPPVQICRLAGGGAALLRGTVQIAA